MKPDVLKVQHTCLREDHSLARLVVSCEGLLTEEADDGGRGQDAKEAVAQLAAQGLQEWVLVSSEVNSVIWLGG